MTLVMEFISRRRLFFHISSPQLSTEMEVPCSDTWRLWCNRNFKKFALPSLSFDLISFSNSINYLRFCSLKQKVWMEVKNSYFTICFTSKCLHPITKSRRYTIMLQQQFGHYIINQIPPWYTVATNKISKSTS